MKCCGNIIDGRPRRRCGHRRRLNGRQLQIGGGGQPVGRPAPGVGGTRWRDDRNRVNHAVGRMRKFGMNPFPPELGPVVHGALCELITQGKIRPAIGRRITMDQVGATLMDHEQRRTQGRTVVQIAAV